MAVKWKVPLDKDGNVQRTEHSPYTSLDPTAKMVEPFEFNGQVKFLRIGPKFSDTEYFVEVVVMDNRALKVCYTAPMFMREFERALQSARPFLGGFAATIPQNHKYGTPDPRTEHTVPEWGLRGRFGFTKRGAHISLAYVGSEVY